MRNVRGLSFLFALALSTLLISCRSEFVMEGKWVAEQAPLVSIYFYPDGTASVSGTGLLGLRWKKISNEDVRIEAMDRKVVFHFRMKDTQAGYLGTLELAGFDALRFKKVQN